MRTRNRNVSHALYIAGFVPFTYQTYVNGAPINAGSGTTGPWSVLYKYSLEHMVDDIGRDKPHGVFHRSQFVEINSTPEPYVSIILTAPYGHEEDTGLERRWLLERQGQLSNHLEWNVTDHLHAPPRWDISPLGFDERVVINDLLEKAKGLKADILLNAIEAHQVVPSIESLADSLPLMKKNWKRIRTVLGKASGGYLAWKFGISPILSDMENIYKFLPKMANDLGKHARAVPIRISKKFLHDFSFDKTSLFDYASNGVAGRERYLQGLIEIAPTTRFVLVVKPNVSYSSPVFTALDYAMRRFATSPASLAWEKVPFSFVVDWLVDVRGVLNKIDSTIGVTPYEIVSFTKSHNYVLNSEMFMRLKDASTNLVIHDKKVASVVYKHYERSLVSQSTSVVWKPRVGKSQVGIAAALLTQALTKLRVLRGPR